MEVKPGYKQTEVGVIPEEWEVRTLRDLSFDISDGNYSSKYPKASDFRSIGVPFIRANNIRNMTVADDDMRFISKVQHQDLQKGHLKANDVLITTRGEIGQVALVPESHIDSNINAQLVRINSGRTSVDHQFLAYSITAKNAQEQLSNLETGSALKQLPVGRLILLILAIPSPPEQRAIAAALSDVDALLGGLDRLIAKKRDLKQAAMQQLLTGQTRLPGFSGAWEVKRIAEIGIPSAEKNTDGATLPVLTCSKHFGFMDSLGFFKNQVFSKDLSTYRVIRRDEIGYPANHVEEGSIGLQYLYDIALVSPIYVVFRVAAEVSSFFLHRLLKLDSYRQRFKTATTSSVDRRGSLRWRAFSEITVELPPMKAEQTAIAAVLSDMDAELAALEARRDKTRDLKQAMMQELLTGKTRLL